MKWISYFLLIHLIGEALSELTCLKSDICFCQKRVDDEEMEVMCNNALSLKLTSTESSVYIQCTADNIIWDQVFKQIDITSIYYKNCPLLNIGFNKTISKLGIRDYQVIILSYIKLNNSLESVYLSNLQNIKHLEISSSIITLTNKSFEGTPNLTKLLLRQNSIEKLPINLFKHLISLEILDLGANKLTSLDASLFDGLPLKSLNLDSNHLTTLNLHVPSLKHLDLSNNNLTIIDIKNLNNLKDLSLNKNFFTKLHDSPFINTSIETLKYNYGNLSLPDKFLTNLNGLQKIQFKSLNLEFLPENMIWGSRNITELSFSSNRLKTVPVLFFRDSVNIKELDFSKNQIEDISLELLRPLDKLEKLDLSKNNLVQLKSFLKHSTNLMYLNLEKNKIWSIDYGALRLSKLKELKLSDNQIISLKSDFEFSLQYLARTEVIDLSHNKIENIDQGWINLVNLKKVNFAYNNISILGIDDLQYFVNIEKTDFRYNPLQTIDLSGLEMFAHSQTWMNSSGKIILSSNELICDCHNYELSRFLQNQLPTYVYKYLRIEQELICKNGMIFKDINLNNLTCIWDQFEDLDKVDCSSECRCTYRPFDNSAIMDCSSSNLTSAPNNIITSKNLNFTELNLRNNFITELPDYSYANIGKLDVGNNSLKILNITKLPKKIMELNLENNKLQTIGDAASPDIFTNLIHLSLSGNLWLCNCETKNTLYFIHKYSSKLTDFTNITCSSSILLQDLLLENLCQVSTAIVAVSMCIALFGLSIGFLLALYYRYKTEIKVWLYAHNIRWPMAEDSIDRNKTYDAFISYSHKDEDFVSKQLVPGLEGGTKPFKLCLHNRDWVVGDWIPAQIARSVDESRRTIIVLSQNFLDSIWGRMEFRTAHSSALKERRSRVIVILYGEVSVEALDPELKAYLSMNTYVKWGDYLFWEKLKYALPHRFIERKKLKNKIIVPDKLNPLSLI